MTTARDSDDLPRIAAQAAWVRRLAVALARDVHAGEDIAQDALLAAARGHGIADLRAWLAGTVRKLARLRLRSEDRRASRELEVARSDRVEDPALAFERLELQEALLGAVRELSEPYRTAVLLRWFEGLDPEEIARRTSTPVRTVHTRLHRALALLRETLDRRSRGDRSRWLAAWLPLFPKSSVGWKWVLAMELKTKLAIAGLAGLTVLTVWHFRGITGESGTPATSAAEPARLSSEPAGTDQGPLEVPGAARDERAPVAGGEAPRPAAQAAATARRIHGVVVDVSGAKLRGLELVFRPSDTAQGGNEVHATSDGLGQFELEVAAPRGGLEPASGDWTLVYRLDVAAPDPPEGYEVVLGHPRTIRGTVVDPDKNPIRGASIWFGPPGTGWDQQRFGGFGPGFAETMDPLRKSLGLSLEVATLQPWRSASLATGEFSIRAVDGVPGFVLGASAGGHAHTQVALPEGDQPVILVLAPSVEARDEKLHGRVVDPAGRGVGGACVLLGTRSARSDDTGQIITDDHGVILSESRGSFSIDLDPSAPGARLIALHPDWLPVIQPCLSASPSDPGAWPRPLLLQFTRPAADIQGVVVDVQEHPVPHAGVRALDPPSWNEMLGQLGEAPIAGGERSDGVLGAGWAETDEQGHFRLRGLGTRSYRLCATHKPSMTLGFAQSVPAGAHDVRIVVGGGGRCPVAGRIVDLRGAPIAGANVWARRRVAGAGIETKDLLETDKVRSDEAGRFALPEISCDSEELVVQPEPGTPAKLFPIDRSAARDALVLSVGRIARVQVEIQTRGLEADTVSFLDPRGTPLRIGMKVGRDGWMGGGEGWDVQGGSTGVLVVSEEATTVVLTQRGKEVARATIHLDPNTTNVVRL